ncbi:endonuclease [Thiomicrorhabdus cannonii]|uniref:endonuclease n=1 Tax=Thiomicrorhabdus cannonii TaxID=2748011 RepID=UPI0015BFFB90|nr:endonuclease [Thiomicrorhabdus cannonii]
MQKKVLITLALLAFSASVIAGISGSFEQAKANMYKGVYQNVGTTFYTGCDWSKKKVDLASCGLQNSFPKGQLKRASRTEAEHVIPASWFYKKNGKWRACYSQAKAIKENPREYCQAHDDEYRNAHNDLVNLRPAVGQINADRSNKPFSDSVSGDGVETFRGKGLTIKITSRVAIPDVKIRGDIARIGFYMAEKYGVTYSKRQLELFQEWDKSDPVDDAERELNNRIMKVQGLGNALVK